MTPPTPSNPSRIYLFAGGGTGGHLYPGLAIAEQLQARASAQSQSIECRFICSDRAIDRTILECEGAIFEPSPAKPVGLRPKALARFLWNWGPAVRHGRQVIKQAGSRAGQSNVHVIAMGGFVAAPIAQAARAERCPVTLVNLDAAPGKANRWIATRADRAFTTFPVAAPYARAWTRIAPIVRSAALDPRTPQQARASLGLHPDRPTLMITGGSQGAGSINRFLIAFADAHPDALRPWQVLHQTGETDNSALTAAYARAGVPAIIERFAHPIGPWWRAADLAIARAGAGSVAEAWAAAVPTLFLPYPWHRDQHQRLNAQPLAEADAATLAVDRIDPATNLGDSGPGPILLALLREPQRLHAQRQALAALGPADGACTIATALWAT